MKEYEASSENGNGVEHLELVRDFLDSTFDSVERDGIMVSRGGGRIWVHESHGVSVPKDATDVSNHQYWLLWSAPADEVFEELEAEFGWSA